MFIYMLNLNERHLFLSPKELIRSISNKGWKAIATYEPEAIIVPITDQNESRLADALEHNMGLEVKHGDDWHFVERIKVNTRTPDS